MCSSILSIYCSPIFSMTWFSFLTCLQFTIHFDKGVLDGRKNTTKSFNVVYCTPKKILVALSYCLQLYTILGIWFLLLFDTFVGHFSLYPNKKIQDKNLPSFNSFSHWVRRPDSGQFKDKFLSRFLLGISVWKLTVICSVKLTLYYFER